MGAAVVAVVVVTGVLETTTLSSVILKPVSDISTLLTPNNVITLLIQQYKCKKN
jgi:hypothetical protein